MVRRPWKARSEGIPVDQVLVESCVSPSPLERKGAKIPLGSAV